MGSRSLIKGPEEQKQCSAIRYGIKLYKRILQAPSNGDDSTFCCRLARVDKSLQPGLTGNGLGLT